MEHPDGYSLSSFDPFIQRHMGMSSSVLHLEHKAGDKLFIDFTGDKLSIVDVNSNEIIPVEVFVTILPCSQLTYVEAVMSQKKEDLITAVRTPCITSAALLWPSTRQGTGGRCRQLIYRSIYPCLEGRVFHDMATLNAPIRVALEIHNSKPFVGRNYSHWERFEEIERPTLGKLNPIRYEQRKSVVLTVMKNDHLRLSQYTLNINDLQSHKKLPQIKRHRIYFLF